MSRLLSSHKFAGSDWQEIENCYGNETGMRSDRVEWAGWAVLVHSARTAVVAVASLLAARLFQLPDAYWAPITTMMITQSYQGAAINVTLQRILGTVFGAVPGKL